MRKQTNDSLSYTIVGSGEVLVCIHGLNLNKKMFEHGRIRDEFQDKKIIAFDLPGYGESKQLDRLDIDAICNMIVYELDRLNISEFSICGYCMGGAFALDIIRLYPNRVKELYLMETMLIYPKWLELSKTVLFEKGYNLLNEHMIAKVLSIIPPLKDFSSDKRNQFCDRKWHRKTNTNYLNIFKNIRIDEYQEFLSTLNIKCSIVMGSNTYHEVYESASLLQQWIKQTSLLMIEDKGHLLFL